LDYKLNFFCAAAFVFEILIYHTITPVLLLDLDEQLASQVKRSDQWSRGRNLISYQTAESFRLGWHWYKSEYEYGFVCTVQQALHSIVNSVPLRDRYIMCAIIMT